jgi:LPS-assembly protein
VLRLACLASLLGVLSASTFAYAQTPAPETESDSDILLRATTITEDRDKNTLTADGNVEVRVGARVLRADRVVYNEKKGTLRAQGHVQISDETGALQFAEDIEIDEDFRNGFATRFAARWQQGGVATASSAVRTNGDRNSLEQLIFTNCPLCENSESDPTWSLRARRAVQNLDTKMISYQDAVLEIKGVPVLYVPYFAHPDPTSGRRSGLLTPDLGISSKVGAFFEAPYYFALSDSQELVVSPLVSQNVRPLIKVDYRKRFFSGYVDLQSSVTYEQEFDSDGNKFGDDSLRSHLYGSGRFDINKTWKWGFGVETQTDDLYDRRYDIDGEDDLHGLFSSQPRQLLTQVFTTGQTPSFYAEAGLLSFQGLRASDDDARFPKVAPLLFAEKIFDFGKNGQVTTEVSAAGLYRKDPQVLPNGDQTMASARVTTSSEWENQYIFGPGLVLSPFALARADVYNIDDGSAVGAHMESRVLGLTGATVSWPLIRTGEKVDLIVEPIVMAAYGSSGANNDDIPNEDSLLFSVDDSNIFRPDPVSGYDLWEGGARGAVGLSTTARFGNGYEVNTTVGRRWREAADPAFTALSNLAGTKSDYIASVSANLGRPFKLNARIRFDDKFDFSRVDARATVNAWRVSGTARYYLTARNASGVEESGILVDGSLKVRKNWSMLYRQQRNLSDNRDILLSVGVGYQDECSFFAITYDRNGAQDRTLGPSDSIRFQFVLTGLGGVSDADAD